jgi:hypothetical protein
MASNNSVRVRTGAGYGWQPGTTLAAMRRRFLFVAAMTLAVVVGCSSGSAQDSTATPSSVTATQQSAAVPAALQFDAPLVGAGRFDARQQAGRPLALWFWAPY